MAQPPRSPSEADDREIAFGGFRLRPSQQQLLDGDRAVALGSRALDILTLLLARAGELVTKEELFASVWPGLAVEESNLRAQVSALRKALRDGEAGTRFVATVPGRGYRFVAPVSRVSGAEPRAAAVSRGGERPVRLTTMIGRDDAVAALRSRLQRRRFVTIVGPGGIGKTTLALAVTDATSPDYADGVHFVDLAPVADARYAPGALASALGLSAASQDPTPDVIAFLRERQALIVLDTCEHVVEAAALLAERVLQGVPGAHVLATSREPLRAEGEGLLRLPPLDAPSVSSGLSAADALSFPAVQLFAERVGACIDGFELSDDDAAAAAEICRRLDGIPLAIEIAARRVDAFGVRGVAEQLDDRFRLLTRGRRTALPRHQTLRAALDWSYEFLPEAEQTLLRRLAVFAGGFTLEMASALAADEGGVGPDVVDGIANLVSRSLIAADVSGATGSYRLLDTTRAYALAKLDESGESDCVRRRHAERMLEVLQRASAEWEKGSPHAGWLARHAQHIDDLRSSLDWAFSPAGDAELGVSLTFAAIPLWFQLPRIEECFGRVQQALESVAPGPSREAHARRAVGLLGALGRALAAGFTRDATEAFAKALALAEELGDVENRLGMLYGLWTCRYLSGEYRDALALAQRFQDFAETSPEPADRFIGDRLLGISLHHLGEQAKARRHLERMLDGYVAPSGGAPTIRFQTDQRVVARATLGRVLWLLGLSEQARRAAQSALEEGDAAGHPIWWFSAMALAEFPIALLVGDLESAGRSLDAMLDHAARGLGPWGATSRAFEGALHIARGDIAVGVDALRAAVAEMARDGQRPDLLLLSSLADALGRTGKADEGFATVEEALERAERHEEHWCTPELLRVKAGLLEIRESADAEPLLLAALDRARRQEALAWELRSATSLARVWHGHGRSGEARALLEPVRGRFHEGLDTADLVRADRLLGELA